MEDLVTLATFEYALHAEVARAALEQEGIPVFTLDSNLVATNWFLGNAVGYIKLQVPRSHVEAALAVLESLPNPRSGIWDTSDADEEVDSVDHCLSCGAEIPKEADSCPGCGWSYELDETEGES